MAEHSVSREYASGHPTADYRHYAGKRMAMKRKLHWPTHIWDGRHLHRMRIGDYFRFFKILFLQGANGIRQPNKHN